MPRRKKDLNPAQKDLLDVAVQLRTAPCVPALREVVKKWRDGGYKGATDTTRLLLNHWFKTDHRLLNGQPFAGIVKRPMKGVAKIHEAKSTIASVRYKPYLTAGVERWKEYRGQLKPLAKKPVLFIMLNETDEAEEVGDWLRTKYPNDFGGGKTLIIHTNKTGEITKTDLDKARQAAREVDLNTNPINAIVSVLMLREGWDVQNVTVVVGLRPYSAKANILPEQTIGRG